MKKLLALITTAVLAATAYAGEFPDISITEVKALLGTKKATIIDANSAATYKSGHIPGAVAYAPGKLAEALPKQKDALIIAYCGSPKCTAYSKAAKEAQKLGYTNIKHLSAGIAGWKEAGEKTEKAN
ncbi:MAG TPA: rhodanese-like domain-containing protein [Verrucomicrobiae bacterium]|jgi:rhodanese-related sulfurtransferase